MKRSWFLTILLLVFCFSGLEGCRNAPTSANGGTNTNGWTEVTSNAPWAARYGLAGTVFNSNMWVIGGASSNASGSVTNYYGDVWKSGDGKNWSSTGSPGFGARYESQVVSFAPNNGSVTQLYLIGGNASGTLKNDVWSSPDGTTWTQILANNSTISSSVVGGTQFCPRQDFCAVVFNNLIWVFSGTNATSGSTGLNDVWSSPDGITWTQVLVNNSGSTTQFTPRWGAAAVSFNNNLYIMCGEYTYASNAGTTSSNIWSSPNGSTWTLLTNNFIPVYYHQLVVNNNAMWFTNGLASSLGGAASVAEDSTNGVNWNPSSGTYGPRFGHLSLSFNNEVWIMGGCDNNNGSLSYYNDVWNN